MKDHVIRARVSSSTKTQLKEMLEREGLPESELIRRFVEQGLDGLIGNEENPSLTVAGSALLKKKVSIRLPEFILADVRARASEKGMSVSYWVSSLIQSHVFQPPVLTTTELKVLNESNRQIRAIGVHLNQIARAFNNLDIDIRKLKHLDTFEMVVKDNLKFIDRLIRATNQSWGIGRGPH